MRLEVEMSRKALGMIARTLLCSCFLLLAPQTAEARTRRSTAPRSPFLFKKGTVDVDAAGQVELTLGTSRRSTYGYLVCNEGTSLILGATDATRNLAPLLVPVAVAPGSTVDMDEVFEIEPGKCVDLGNFNSTTLVLEADTVNGQAWRVLAKR